MRIVVDLFNQHSANTTELKRMALSAFMSGADYVKLQLFDSQFVWGDDRRNYLELSYEEVADFAAYCKSIGVGFTATPFDKERADWLETIGVDFYKVASITAKNNPDVVEHIISKDKEVIVSLGQFEVGDFPYGEGRDKLRYLFCIPEYPTYLDNPKLKLIPENFSKDKYYGYSDHTLGIAACLIAANNGAEIIEKHYTHNQNAQKNFEMAHLGSFTQESLAAFKNITREFDLIKL